LLQGILLALASAMLAGIYPTWTSWQWQTGRKEDTSEAARQ
jgi:hypothetical protein